MQLASILGVKAAPIVDKNMKWNDVCIKICLRNNDVYKLILPPAVRSKRRSLLLSWDSQQWSSLIIVLLKNFMELLGVSSQDEEYIEHWIVRYKHYKVEHHYEPSPEVIDKNN